MKKTKMTTKALSMLLTVIMLFTTISVGIVVPDGKLTADAATVGETHTVTTIEQLNSAITSANNAGTGVITTIKLGANIQYNNTDGITKGAFTTISSANIVLDLSGYSIIFSVTKSGDWGSTDNSVQLPNENAGNNYKGKDILTKAMINVSAGSTLQIISSANGNGSTIQVATDIADNDNNSGDTHHQTSAHAIYSEGTLIIGDPNNSLLNDVNIYAHSSSRNTNGSAYWYVGDQRQKSASANSYAITVNGSSSIFKMYGGKVQATGNARCHRNAEMNLRVYALNIEACYSAEIYGGTVSIPGSVFNNLDVTGIRNSEDKAASSADAQVSAIRCNTPNLYIFDVDSTIRITTGDDTSKNNSMTASNVFSTSEANAATIYGGNYSYNVNANDGDSSTASIKAYTVRGPYNIAINNTLSSYFGTDREYTLTKINSSNAKSFVCYTLFIHDGGTAENGLDIFSYRTFREYRAQLTTALDVYAGCAETASHHSDANSYTCDTKNYLRNGYTQSGWIGKTHPAGGLDYVTTGAASLNATYGGSLFLQPVWTENIYNITYDWNDGDSDIKVSDTSSCPATYKITTSAVLGTPVRHGYRFVTWAVTAYDYPATDTKKPWSLAEYPAGFSLSGRNGHLWLQAKWEEIPYKATFDLDGGNIAGSTADVVLDYSVNSSFRFPQSIWKDYYTFDGYFKVETADGSWAKNDTLYAAGDVSAKGQYGDPVFKAQYTPIQYKVTYDSNNGSSVDDEAAKTYNYESTHVLPAITRQGYHFVGWVPVESKGSWSGAKVYPAGFSFNKMYGDVTFVAKWESAVFKLNLDLAENESISGATEYNYAYANSLTISNPSKTGYTFAGWKVKTASDANTTWVVGDIYKDGIEDGSVTIPANKLGNVTLEPMWNTVSYTVSFNSNGGQGCESFTYTIEDSFLLPVTTKKGYSFAGWSVTENGGNWNKSNYAGNETVNGMYGDVTLFANWTIADYTVTLDADGGTVNPSAIAYNFESQPALPVPSKTGYSFTGWRVSLPDASSSWIIDTVYTDTLPSGQYGNVTLTAQWEHTAYNIHFVSSGSTPSDLKYYIDSPAFRVPASSYPGFRFLYWNVTTPAGNWDMNEKVYADTDISKKYGNVTLNANFEAISYTIIYKYDDENSKTVNYDMSTPVTLENYEKAGYIFGGWRVESLTDGAGWSGTYQPGDYTAGERYGNVVLVPVLTPVEYEITFIPDGGTPYANLSYIIESTDTLPTPVKTGYDFDGWEVTVAGGNWTDGELIDGGAAVTGKYGNVTLTAKWTPKLYTITWVTGNGTHTTDAPYGLVPDYSSVNTSKPMDAQYTYTFTGWSPALTTVTGEATYTAQYSKTVNSYTVTWKYETDETSGVKTETDVYSYGEMPVFNNGINPEKTSSTGKYYRFIGWEDENGNALDVVTGDATYTAQFKEVEAPRTVKWVIDDKEQSTLWGVGETPVYVGTPVKADVDGIKYTFSHWSPAVTVVAANTDYRYEAIFTQSYQSYTAEFDADGGNITGGTELTYNKSAGLTMPQPVKEGYSFAGWRVVSTDGTWTSGQLLTYTTYTGLWGNVSLKAEYIATEYIITVEADDGTTPEYTYTIESTDTLPALTKDGFVLSGWMVVSAEGNWVAGDTVAADKVLTGMFGNVTVHPLWTARLYKINWVSGDITQTVEFKFGDAVVTYPPIAKSGYTAAWDKTVPAVMPAEDLTFTAVYTPIQYYLRFNSNGGSAVENFYYDITSAETLPVPTREGATFKGWKVSAGTGSWVKNKVYEGGTALTGHYGNITLTAVWEIQIHTVTWVAGDITKVTKWYHGATPSFDGVPYKSSDDYNSYEFTGWDKEIVTVTKDTTYTALFEATERKYIIRWNVDGHIVEEDICRYGETPSFDKPVPTRPSTTEFDFTFAGWTPEISKVTGDVTYVAVFDVFTKLQGLRIDKTAVFMDIDGEAVLTAIISPATASSKDVNWISSDESVAKVDVNGKVTAVGTGNAVIRVESKDGKFKSYCVIDVAPVITEYIVITANGVSTTQLPGTAIQLTATVQPSNATNKNLKWSSADTTIAMVDANGLVVFGDIAGTTVITAVADGYAVGTIEVTTTTNETEIEDNVKTYMVMFTKSTSSYVIDGTTYESLNVIYPEGATVEFILTEPHFVTLNGNRFERDTDGVYRIKNLSRNYTVVATERADIGFEDEDGDGNTAPSNPSFFERVKAFFRSIIEFFRNLFG